MLLPCDGPSSAFLEMLLRAGLGMEETEGPVSATPHVHGLPRHPPPYQTGRSMNPHRHVVISQSRS